MKAVVCTQYGSPDVLQIQEVDKPTPDDNDLLIKIHATTVSSGDYSVRSFTVPAGLWIPSRIALGLRKPRQSILGMELSGVVEGVGKDVTLFKPGDQVFAYSGTSFGAYAEFICLSADSAVVHKPENITYEQAAAILHGALAALYFLRDKGKLLPGEKLLINGASGAVGAAAIQLAKVIGAEVTGVCSTENVELVFTLGADYVIDYKKEDFVKNGINYDIIFDAVSKCSFTQCKDSLANNGRYILTLAGVLQYLQIFCTAISGGKRIIGGSATEKKEDLIFIQQLVSEGKLIAAIDRCYPMEHIVKAHQYAEKGHKKGSVVIIVTPE